VSCPGPIVEAKKLLNGMRAGETLKLVSNCPGIAADVEDWVKATGLTLRGVDEVGAGEFEFYIAK
jgi:TusA-related sulfurtransferase